MGIPLLSIFGVTIISIQSLVSKEREVETDVIRQGGIPEVINWISGDLWVSKPRRHLHGF